MKKLAFTLFILLLFVAVADAQEELVFKPGFSPEKKYTATISQTSNSEIKYAGSPEALKQLEERRAKNPPIKIAESTIQTIAKTGELVKGGAIFPIKVEYVRTKNSDNQIQVPSSTVVYGHCKVGETAVLDSIAPDKSTDKIRKSILNTVQKLVAEVYLPEKKLHIGDEFTIETPLKLPVAGMNVEMSIFTTYKLQHITKGFANFDVTQKYIIKPAYAGYIILGTGSGKGIAVYDIENHFNIKYELDTELSIDMSVKQLTMTLSSKGTYKQATVISK